MIRFAIALFALAFSITSIAQTPDVAIDGVVYGNNGLPLKGVIIVLQNKEGEVVQRKETRPNGKFDFGVSFDLYLEIILSKAGFEPKMLVFDSRNVPASEQGYNYEYGGFRVTLGEGDDARTPQQVAYILFDPAVGNFVHRDP
ncbi:MAG: hypothetical protein HQ500_06935 [Flavobacteriales bacterium]|nr:hypothetical protein [Flavobacteriales bacterium]